MTRLALLWQLAVLMTEAAGMQAAGPPHGDIDSNCLLQLLVEDPYRNASSAAEASAGAKPVEEIAAEELGAMESIMGKELGVMDKALGVMEQSMGRIVEMKEVELGVVKREQGTEPARGATKNGTQAVQHVLGGRVLGERDSTEPWESSAVDFLDLATNPDADIGRFFHGFADGTYGYCVPSYGSEFGKVARFDLAGFNTVEVLDLTASGTDLRGFRHGFADGTYGYCLPYWTGGPAGHVARFDLAGFNAVQALDLTASDTGLKGFTGGFTDGTYGYCVPYWNGVAAFAKVARFDLAGFTTVQVLDLTVPETFSGGFADGTYGYVMPYGNQNGKVVRFDLAGFTAVQVLDLTDSSPDLKHYSHGFTDGTYGYATPYWQNPASKVVRFDLAGFTTVQVLDAALGIKGFEGGFTDGTYGYLIPYYLPGGYEPGTVTRFDLAGFSTVQNLDLTTTEPELKRFQGGFTDGTYGYAVPWRYGKVARFAVSQHVPLDFSGPGAASDQSSVVGDPHVVSVAKARFEIRAGGAHKLVQIPRFIRANEKPDLRVDARIEHLVGNDCSKSFMTSLGIFGRWTEDASVGLVNITQGSDMPNTTLLVNTEDPEAFFKQFPLPDVKVGDASVAFKVKGVRFHVGKHFEGRYGKQRAYLNVRIVGLKQYQDLGGLLGYDGHADAEKPDANCAAPAARPAVADQSSFIGGQRSVPSTDGGSRIEAE